MLLLRWFIVQVRQTGGGGRCCMTLSALTVTSAALLEEVEDVPSSNIDDLPPLARLSSTET